MLLQFTVGNFRSFCSKVTLALDAVKAFKEHPENVVESGAYRLLTSAAVYGANASGKSNLIKAMAFMRHFVLNSAKSNSTDEIDTEPFRLDLQTLDQPSLFEAVFLIDEWTYRYGFEVTTKEVRSEWLFRARGPRGKSFYLFKRERDGIDVSDDYPEGKGREEDTRDNALFISTVDQRNGAMAHQIIKWFSDLKLISGMHDFAYLDFTGNKLSDSDYKEKITAFIRQIDESVTDIDVYEKPFPEELLRRFPQEFVKRVAPQRNFSFQRVQRNGDKECGKVSFDLEDNESAGTVKMLGLAGPWIDILENGRTAFVDELEAKLHPHLVRQLVRLFNSSRTNTHNAQLVFVTHDTNLLTYGGLRRDQIWFCEKDRGGATDLYSLAEIKVRGNASFARDYLSGRYGAIPYFGDFSILTGTEE